MQAQHLTRKNVFDRDFLPTKYKIISFFLRSYMDSDFFAVGHLLEN